MITTLDTQSWAKELVTGNAAFIQRADGVIFIVTNVRIDNTFGILHSDPVPPAPGPGSTFTEVATVTVPAGNTDFDPVVEYDESTGKLHIVGILNDPSYSTTLDDLVKFTYDTGSTVLTGPFVLASGFRVRDAYDICILGSGHTLVGACVDEADSYLDGTVTPQAGLNLVVMELDASDAVVPSTTVELATSPRRSGDSFSSVSLISPDGVNVELYCESHPKLVTFKDQVFTISEFDRDSFDSWGTPTPPVVGNTTTFGGAKTDLTTFIGRFTDDRLTVIANGSTRLMSQVYYNQLAHPQGLVGNLVLGFFEYSSWNFHTILGTVIGGSFVQATPSISASSDMNVAYLLEPFNSPATAWPMRVATVDTNLVFTDVPGFYNQQTFTWLRGTKSILDSGSAWAIVGERVQTALPSPLPVYVSLFDVPPIALLDKTAVTVYRGGTGWKLGTGHTDDASELPITSGDLPLQVSAADSDQDALKYVWSHNDPDKANVILTANGPHATLDVTRAAGTSAPVATVTHINITSFLLTVTVANSFRKDTQIQFQELGIATYLNGQVVIVIDATATAFTATVGFADDDTNDLGVAIPIAGAARAFTVGVAVIDLFSDLVTPRHPSLDVTNISVAGGVLTVTAANNYAAGETTMLYDVNLAPPAAPTLSQVVSGAAALRTYHVKVAYLNIIGETLASAESTFAVSANNVLKVTSPSALGDPALEGARTYNVYVTNDALDTEKLQNLSPILLGTDWTEPDTLLIAGRSVPTISTATLVDFSDQVVAVLSSGLSSSQFEANVVGPMPSSFSSCAVVGFASTQYQYATCDVTVPFNTAPAAVQNPQFEDANITGVEVDGSNLLTITADNGFIAGQDILFHDVVTATFLNGQTVTVLASGLSPTQFTANFTHAPYSPAADTGVAAPLTDRGVTFTFAPTITGVNQIDDTAVFTWTQTSGTPVTFLHGADGPTIVFKTLGMNVHGETLAFALVVSDDVNPSVPHMTTFGDVGIFHCNVRAYDLSSLDTNFLARANWAGTISQRNSAQTWGALMVSSQTTDLDHVKRTSVLDGSSRYLIITPHSVTVYGEITPFVLYEYRKLLTPNVTAIVDAVHTEHDYTLVLDEAFKLFRYSSAPLINTDNPDTTITLTAITALRFNRIFSTASFADVRILVLSGPDGILLLQVKSSNLEILATLELTTTSGFIYGANNVQFVRTNGVESLRQGKVLIGTVTYSNAPIEFVAILDNALYVVGGNTFVPPTRVTLAGLTTRIELNKLTPEIISASSAGYIASLTHVDYGFAVTNVAISGNILTVTAVNSLSPGQHVALLGLIRALNSLNGVPLVVATASGTQFTVNPINQTDVASTPTTGAVCLQDSGTSTALNEGTTYETLVDLPHSQILGTWDASKLRNQFVDSGEILFEPDSTYSGKPPAPVLAVPSVAGLAVTLVWTEERPDLVFAYNVEKSTDGIFYSLSQRINSGASQSTTAVLTSGTYYFRVKAFSADGESFYSNVRIVTI